MGDNDQVNVTFLGFGRVKDGVILATWAHQELEGRNHTEETFTKILHAAKVRLAPGQRQRLMWENSTVSIMLNQPAGDIMYGIVSSSFEYPERLAYQCLTELAQHVETEYGADLNAYPPQGLRVCEATMGRLAGKYQDPASFDKIARLQHKTGQLKDVMKGNIKEMVANTEKLDILQDDAQDMEVTANEYNEKSKEIKNYFWWKDCKMLAVVGCLATVLVIVLVSWIVGFFRGDTSKRRLAEILDGSIDLEDFGAAAAEASLTLYI